MAKIEESTLWLAAFVRVLALIVCAPPSRAPVFRTCPAFPSTTGGQGTFIHMHQGLCSGPVTLVMDPLVATFEMNAG